MQKHLKYLEIIGHILFWMVLFYIAYSFFATKNLIRKSPEGLLHIVVFSKTMLYAIIVDLILKIGLFYGMINYFLPKMLKRHFQWNAALNTFFLFAITLFLSLSINTWILTFDAEKAIHRPYTLVGVSVLFHIFIFLIALAYRLSKDWLKNERIQRDMLEEKLKTELNFLKNQINPHFLFNTLNNLYAEARRHEDKTVANGIAKLSGMMRYMIYDSNIDFVSLEKEVTYLKNYMELEQLRIAESDPFELHFKEEGEGAGIILIAPMLFIPFVENAFKHGRHFERPSYIHVYLNYTKEALFFSVENSRFEMPNLQKQSGIGLKNVKRRLTLLYPNKHELNTVKEADKYLIKLKIDLT